MVMRIGGMQTVSEHIHDAKPRQRVQFSTQMEMRIINLVLALLVAGRAPAVTTQGTSADLGARTYATHCASCHGENGEGVHGTYPPLAAHAADLVSKTTGREYLIRLMLSGREGEITVKGERFVGVMPGQAALGDGEIAAVLNYAVTAWDNYQLLPAPFEPFQGWEIAAARIPQMRNVVTFTAEQVTEGKTTYEHNCQDCHGSSLDNGEFGGPPLRGARFLQRWDSGSVASLYTYTKTKMPPDRPGGLSDKVYADLVAFILRSNGYPSGEKELPTDPKAQEPMSLKRN